MMTDARRIELTSVKPVEKDKKVKRRAITVRLVLSLGESNATSCPEYSFADLVKAENERFRAPDIPFEDDDEVERREVAAIAQRFEAKYGTKPFKASRKKQTQDMDDYFDVGDGYDDDDSFIDNSEAYDEVVPSTLTTKYGGFYINQGKLDFKSISDDSNDDFAAEKIKKKNKRRISDTDSEEETPEALAKKFKAMKRKKYLEGRESEKKKKKLGIGLNGDLAIKKKKKKSLHKIANLSRDQRPQKDSSTPLPKMTAATVGIKTSTLLSTVITTTAVMTSPPSVTVSSTTPTSQSVNGVSPSEEVPLDIAMKESFNAVLEAAMKDESSSKSGEDDKKSESLSEEKNTQLPNLLPTKLLEDINKLKLLAKNSTEGKSKFFSAPINKLLLTIERESLKLPNKCHRTAVFNHLGEHLPSGKHTLLRRAKKLRQTEDQLNDPIEKLRQAIKDAMPKAIENHRMVIAKAKLDAKANGSDAPNEDGATESDEEEGKADTKKTRMPRRKFIWTQEAMELFLIAVKNKNQKYNAVKAQQQSPDEYLKSFLDSEIKPLWPTGWMNTRALFKIVREENMTSGNGKSKKTISGKVSPVPVSEPTTPIHHVSKMDDVIEISSIMDDVEEKKNVVINLPGSEVKPPVSVVTPPSRSSISTFGGPIISSNMQGGKAKSESVTVANVSSVGNNIQIVNSVRLPDKIDKMGTVSTYSQKVACSTTVIDITDSPVKETPLKMGSIIPSPIPISASTPILTGSDNMASPSLPVNNRSFLQAFESSIRHKEGVLPSKPQVSLSSPHQQQHKSNSMSNNVFQQQQQQQKKLQPTQGKNAISKTGSSQHQPKHTQESNVSSHVYPKSTIAGVSKDLHPVVSMNRIPVTGMVTPKQSPLSSTKSGNSQTHSKLSFVSQRQTPVSVSFPSSQTLNVTKKKQIQTVNPLPSQSNSSPFTSQQSRKTVTSNSPSSLLSSSGDAMRLFSSKQSVSQPVSSAASSTNNLLRLNKNLPMNNSPRFGSQVKSGIVLGTSLSELRPQTDRHTPRHTMPISKPLTVQTSPVYSSVGSNKNVTPPSNKVMQSSSSLLSLSRNSTPSPQKSPASPGNSATSLFDRIQSQIRNQEATQEQGLKVLAMAMKIEETGLPSLGHGRSKDSPSGKW